MTEIDATQFMTDIFGMWTEPDVDARRAVIQSRFDEGVHFHDPDGESVGHAGLEAFSDSLQSRFPGARFTLAGAPRTLSNSIRAFWHFGSPDNPQAVSGMDFVIWDGEKASSLYAFVDDPSGGGQPPN
jgi:SnoaL-like domain